MQSYTSQTDQLYCEAALIKFSDFAPSYSNFCKRLGEQENIIHQAREMETATRDIRKLFQEIAESGFPVPNSTLLHKAVVSVKKGKPMFSSEQLKHATKMVMGDLPYILFRPKLETKDYVILLFWSTSFDDTACEIQQKTEIIKQEVTVDSYQLRFKVENISSPRRCVLYLLNNFNILNIQNDNVHHLPPQDHQQLVEFLNLLEGRNVSETLMKKRKCDEESAFF